MILTLVVFWPSAHAQESEPPADPPADDGVEEVVVTGTRTGRKLGEEPVAVEVITRDDIDKSGAYDLSELLDQHPGIDVARDVLGASIRLRGLDADQTLFLVDGQRVVGRTGGVLDLSRISLDAVERIEIVKGPASALYGSDALGGVVHVVTRGADQPQVALSARQAYPLAGDVSASASGVGALGGLRVSGGWHGSPTFDLDPVDVPTSVDGNRQGDGTARFDPDLGPNTEAPVSFGYSLTDAHGIDGNDAGALFDRRTVTEDVLATVRPAFVPDDVSRYSVHLGLSLFRDQYLSDQRASGVLDLYEETWETLLQVSTQYDRLVGRQFVTLGIDSFAEWIASPRLEAGAGSRQRGAVFLQDEWRVADDPRWVLVPGVRLDLDTWFGAQPTPKLATRLDPHRAVTLRGSVGTGWRAPNFRELLLRFENPSAGYVVTGNPDLRPESSRTVDAAFEWDPAPEVGWSIASWWTRLDSLIDIATLADGTFGSPSQFGYVNVDEARTRGIETGFSLRPSRRVEADLSYTLTDAWNLTEDRPLSGRAVHRGSVGFDAALGDAVGRFGARAVLVGPRPFFLDEQIGFLGEPQTEPTVVPAYVLLDVRYEHRLEEGLAVFVGVDNALDQGDPDFLATSPVMFFAGLDARVAAGRR